MANDELLALLESGNYEYKGFKFTLEFDSTNTFSFPARRIKAVRSPQTNIFGGGVTLYSSPPDLGAGVVNTDSSYSFSTSIQVLVDETKFNIDQYIIQSTSLNNIGEIDVKQAIIPSKEEKTLQSIIDRGFTESEAKWIIGEDYPITMLFFHMDQYPTLTPSTFFKVQLKRKLISVSEDFVNYLVNAQSAFEWIIYIQQSYPNFSLADIDSILYIAENVFNLPPYTGS